MRIRALGAFLLIATVTAGCSAAADEEQSVSSPTSTAVASPSPTLSAEATPEPEKTAADADALPERAEMDQATRVLAEAFFTQELSGEAELAGIPQEDLIRVGDAVCDSMDRGDSFQSVLIVGASLLPNVAKGETIAAIVGTAAGVLCPEHADYTG